MKHSRIFLGATTALLAIAGIAAAKAHRAPVQHLWYFTKVVTPAQTCPIAIDTRCTINGLTPCLAPNGAQIYTIGGSGVICATPVRYNKD